MNKSKVIVGKILQNLGIVSSVKKIGGKSINVYVGITNIIELNEF